ncbi:MAG: hypothetical protein IJ202_11665, partial [Bacteroidales bacterium]|nr:hypothetical protein [Bacteroidales bacterium]
LLCSIPSLKLTRPLSCARETLFFKTDEKMASQHYEMPVLNFYRTALIKIIPFPEMSAAGTHF